MRSCLPGERCSPNEEAPTARRESSAAAARELAGTAERLAGLLNGQINGRRQQ